MATSRCPSPPPPQPYFLSLWIHLSWTVPINGVRQAVFSVWLLLHGLMVLSFVHAITCAVLDYLPQPYDLGLYGLTTSRVPSHLLMDIWFVSALGLLWIMLPWTFTYEFLWAHTFLFLLRVTLGVKLLGHVVTPCLTFQGTAKLFSTVTVESLYVPTSGL